MSEENKQKIAFQLDDAQKKRVTKIIEQLDGAFPWERTPQGRNYWREVSGNLGSLLLYYVLAYDEGTDTEGRYMEAWEVTQPMQAAPDPLLGVTDRAGRAPNFIAPQFFQGGFVADGNDATPQINGEAQDFQAERQQIDAAVARLHTWARAANRGNALVDVTAPAPRGPAPERAESARPPRTVIRR